MSYTLRSGKTYNRYPKKKATVKPIATKKVDVVQDREIATLKRAVSKLKHLPEVKYKQQQASNPLSAPGSIFLLTSVAQGDNFDQRVGEEIICKSIQIGWRWQHQAGAIGDQIRVIVFWDLQNNSSGPEGLASIYGIDNSLLDDTVITRAFAPINRRLSQRFKVLSDNLYLINPNASNTIQNLCVKKSYNLGGARLKFTDSAATIASLPTRALYMYITGIGVQTALPDYSTVFNFTDV